MVLAFLLTMIGVERVAVAATTSEAVAAGGVVPVAPARLLDTRPGSWTVDGDGIGRGVVPKQSVQRVQVTGRADIPSAGVAGAVLNVAMVGSGGPGFLTVFPCDEPVPNAANVNVWQARQTVSGSVVVKLGPTGEACIYTSRRAHLVVDVSGWIADHTGDAETAGGIQLITPARLMDSRAGARTIDGKQSAAGRTRPKKRIAVQVLNRSGVEAPLGEVAGALLTVAAQGPTGAGYATVMPCGVDTPNAANLNWTNMSPWAGSNRVVVPLGDNDEVCIETSTDTSIIVDISGYVLKGGSDVGRGSTVLNTPSRLLDTRPSGATIDGVNSVGRIGKNQVVRLPVLGRAGVPADQVSGVWLNVTSVQASNNGFLTVIPCPESGDDAAVWRQAMKTSSTVNWSVSRIGVSNAAFVPVGADGTICVASWVEADVVVDLAGYVAGQAPGPVEPDPLPPDPDPTTGGEPPVEIPGVPAPNTSDGSGEVDVPVDVPFEVPDITLPGGGRWEYRLTKDMRDLDGFVSLRGRDADDVGRRVIIEVLDPAEVESVGAQGIAVWLAPTDGKGEVDVDFEFNIATFTELYGGDWQERLRGVTGDDCTWSATAGGCADDMLNWTESTNDLETNAVSMSATYPEVPQYARPSGFAKPDRGAPVKLPDSFVAAAPAGGGKIAGLLTDYAGSSGNYAASEMAAQGSWSGGGSAGGFSYSYPFNLPDAGRGGPAPAFGLSYSSQALDGMNSNTNSQSSQVGLGWTLSGEAYITRAYASCTSLGGSAEDQCWDGQQVSLVLNGVSSRLVPEDAAFTKWRLEDDNGWRLTRHASGAPGSSDGGGSDGLKDNDGEYWELFTADGELYRFGYGQQDGEQLNSVWTVPVIGSKSGDPCRGTGKSICQQAWRWNLDRVEDAVGVSMLIQYEPEFNYYAALGSPSAARRYVRAGLPKNVWWGIPIGGGVAQASHKMVFSSQNRCNDLSDGCVGPSKANKTKYPDAPVDKVCTAGEYCSSRRDAPTFFTTRRLKSVTTYTNAGGWADVDTFTLTHEFVTTGGLNRLWLRTVQRQGLVGDNKNAVTLPAVRFESFAGGTLANRHDANPAKGVSAIELPRINTVRDELGGQTNVEYFQPDPCKGQPAGGWDTNTTDCYPAWWTPTDYPAGAGFAVFNVYLVKSITTGTIAPGSSFADRNKWYGTPITTRYEYLGGAGYRHAQLQGVRYSYQSWSQYRGYGKVRETTGTGASTTETTYFRGLNGNRAAGGGTQEHYLNSSVGLQPGAAPWTVPDFAWLKGMAYETRVLDGGRELSGSVAVPHQVREFHGQDLGIHSDDQGQGYKEGPLHSRMMKVQDTWTRTANTEGTNLYEHWGFQRTQYEPGWGLSILENHGGDTAIKPRLNNQRCTKTDYATIKRDGKRPGVVRTFASNCDSEVLSTAVSSWDQSGRITSEAIGKTANDATLLGTVSYGSDPFGRPSAIRDGNANATTLVFSGPAGSEKTTVTGPTGLTTTRTISPRGDVVTATDSRANTTTIAYDALGRTVRVTKPHPDTGAPIVTDEFVYRVAHNSSKNGYHQELNRIDSRSLTNPNYTGSPQLVSQSFVDGLGRAVQAKMLTAGGAEVTSGTLYDDRGLTRLSYDAVPVVNKMSTNTIDNIGANGPTGPLANTVTNSYDALGRTIKSVEQTNSTSYTSTFAYDGYVTTAVTPGRGAVISTVDAYGQTLSTLDTGSGRAVNTTYDGRGLVTGTGPDSARVTIIYDAIGRMTSKTEANSGTMRYEYDANGNPLKQTDANGNVLRVTYDALNRPLTRTDQDGNQLAAWSYYQTGRNAGLPETETAFETGGTYTKTMVDYDRWGRPLETRYDVPGIEPYTESVGSYTPAGVAKAESYTAVGQLASETITAGGFDPIGSPTTLSGAEKYLTGIAFDQVGRIVGRSMNNGAVQRSYRYNDRRQLAALTATNGVATVQNDVYEYGVTGAVSSIDHQASADGTTHKECFVTDDALRLVRAYTVASGGACGGTASLSGSQGVGPDGVGYDERWMFNADSLMLGRTKKTADNPAPGEASSFSYGPGPAQIASDGRTGFEYDNNGARVATANIDQIASSLQLLEVPGRALDTRLDPGTKIPAGGSRTIDLDDLVDGAGNPVAVPANAVAVVVNAVVVDPDGSGATLSLYPVGQTAGTNHPAVRSRGEYAFAGMTIVQLGSGNRIKVAAGGVPTHAVLDVTGFFVKETGPVAAGRVGPLQPTRVYDSRTAGSPLANKERREISVAAANLPDDAEGVIATITAANPVADGYIAALPVGTDTTERSPVSTVNFEVGSVRANETLVYVPVGGDRDILLYTAGVTEPGQPVTDVVIDVVGYVTGDSAIPSEVGLFTPFPFALNIISENIDGAATVGGLQAAGIAGVPPADETLMVVGTIDLFATADGPAHAQIVADGVNAPTTSVNAGAGEAMTAFATTAVSDEGKVQITTGGEGGLVRYNIAGFYRASIPDPAEAHDEVQPSKLDWDVEQNLAATTSDVDGEPATTAYDYWPDGSRVAQHHPDGSTTYYLGKLEANVNADGGYGDLRRSINADGVPIASRMVEAGSSTAVTTYLLGNHQGSITTTISNGVASSRWYDPYGKARGPKPASSPITTGFLNQHEDGSGLTYLNNRYHDVELGMFISVDPMVSQTFEPYLYARANPLVYSDALGLFGLSDIVNIVEDVGRAGAPIIDAAKGAASDLAGGARDLGGAVVDRGSTLVAYAAETTVRRARHPIQSIVDFSTGTMFVEELAAVQAIVISDGELYHGDPDGYCGPVATCIVGVPTPKGETGAITLGHTVLFGQESPGGWLVAHEVQHVFDIENFGAVGFYAAYGGEYAAKYVATTVTNSWPSFRSVGLDPRNWLRRRKVPIVLPDGEQQKTIYKSLWAERRGYDVQNNYKRGRRPSRWGPYWQTPPKDSYSARCKAAPQSC